jgi:hypothetical protein
MKTRIGKIWSLALGGLLLATSLAYAGSSAAQGTDMTALIQARNAAMNAGDLEKALSFYADDAAIRDRNPEPGTTGVIRGKAEVRQFLAGNIAAKIRLESYDFQVSGDTVSFTNRVWVNDPDLTRLNLLPVISEHTVAVRDGKIQDWLSGINAEWMARAEAAFAAEQTTAAGMPRTGGTELLSGAWLLVAALVIGLCGLALRRATFIRRSL